VGNVTFYQNGQEDGTASGFTLTAAANPFTIGRDARGNSQYYWDGMLDEIRVSTVVRSADWIWAEYMNMASNGAFNAHSPARPAGSGAVMIFR
jgi:hypothetical protein